MGIIETQRQTVCPFLSYQADFSNHGFIMILVIKTFQQVVIITSVPVHDEPHKTSVYAYNRQGNRYWKVTCPYLPAHYPGTGDTFTSVITGSLMQGDSLPMALDRATQFILQGIRATFGYEYDNREGILLEKVLHNLDMPIQMASYELI